MADKELFREWIREIQYGKFKIESVKYNMSGLRTIP